MTVSTQVSRNEYTGNGATTQYDFTFRILDKSHLLVQTLDTSENIVTLTLGTDYTVTGVNRYNGGKVVLTSALPAGYKISIERSTPVTQEASIRNQGGFFPEIHEDAFDKLTMLVQQAYGWWSGLSLRKPSWLANYYDALNNRIRNLRDPSLAQDAATKGYTDSADSNLQQQINVNQSRALRVPEAAVGMVPAVAGRKNKILAFNSSGDPIAVLPESGSAADVLIQLASSDLSGGTLVQLREQINVQGALSPMLYSGRVVRLSVFYARGLTNDAAFAAAFEASKNADGYNCRIIVNDTPYTVEITDTVYQFRTNLETRYNLNTYSGFNCGVVGEFKFNGTAQFKFIRCYRPYVNVVIQGGTGIAGIDTTTPANSSVAVQLDTVVVGAEIHIDIVNYPGYGLATFGTKFLTSQGVKGLYPSTVNAYLSGGAVYMAGTNGFGEFSSIWELDCTHGSVFNAIYDVVVHKYEGSDLLVNICNSIRFGYLLLGVANAKIFDSQGVYVGHHLGVAGASATVKQTEDLFVMDIVNSWVRFGQSRLFGANCGFRIGSAANVLFDSLEGYHINQAISITNNTSYTGTSNSPTVDVHVKQINIVNGNGQFAFSSKHCIHVDDGMLANLTVEDGRIQWNVNGRTSEYAYAIYGGSLSTSHIKIDNVRLLGNYDAEPVYMPNYDCIVKMHTPDTEVNVGGTRTTGSGRRLRINWGMSTAETEYASKPNKRVYVVATVNAAGGNFIARVDGKPAMYAAGVAGTFSGTFEVSKGQKAYYSMASSSVVDSYAELELG
ncbi:phage tail fiber protein [Klebsiella pneumoniae]|uniref:phage tail fiber domain-containing protein n=1 Tax=Klebsiella pneumoniae TaxID=573 RepID=UPI00312D3282